MIRCSLNRVVMLQCVYAAATFNVETFVSVSHGEEQEKKQRRIHQQQSMMIECGNQCAHCHKSAIAIRMPNVVVIICFNLHLALALHFNAEKNQRF